MDKVQPYDFVPIVQPIEKKSYKNKGHLSGTLKVKITVKSPFIEVNEGDQKTQQQRRGQSIPGSSIRGALRSAAEILWNGTVSVFKSDPSTNHLIKEEWKTSNSTIEEHCPVSHIFGFAASEKNKKKTDELDKKVIWAMGSKVKFSKASVVPNTLNGAEMEMTQLYTPKNFPKKTGSDGKQYFLGRKLYLAGRYERIQTRMKLVSNSTKKIANFNQLDYFAPPSKRINAKLREYVVFPGTQFTFHIEFQHLNEAELADLIRLLELKDSYYHSVGKGKPLGLGRLKFEVEGIKYKDKDYFLSLDLEEKWNTEEKGRLILSNPNTYETNFNKYYEFLEEAQFDNKKTYGERNGDRVYRYSQIKGNEKPTQQVKTPPIPKETIESTYRNAHKEIEQKRQPNQNRKPNQTRPNNNRRDKKDNDFFNTSLRDQLGKLKF